MHELSIALSVLEMAQEEAQRHGCASADAVRAIHLRLGPLSGVASDALAGAFELARELSPLADCRLVIDEVPITAHCPSCRAAREVVSLQHLCCSVCGSPTPEILTGRELEVTALEIDA